MVAKLGLPDDEIDRLLSEAEARLSANGSSDAAVTAVKAPAPVAAPVTAPVAATAGEQTALAGKKSEKLSLRVPQLAQTKKGPPDTLSDWYNLPRTNLTPELKRDLQVLRMRDVVAMGKQFFKRDTRKDFVPEYSQVGTIIAGATDGINGCLTRKERKRTIVEEVLSSENLNNTVKGHADMNSPRLIRPLRPLVQGQHSRSVSPARSPSDDHPPPSAQPTAATTTESNGTRVSRMPRALEALYLKPLRRQAEYGVPSCDLQLRSYSVRNLEFFCDFALRAAYYLNLPAYGPVPLPRLVERWTVPKSTFIFKKSQENFERITLRRLIQIRDGHPETVNLWLAFLQKHAYYGIGMKANIWEFSKLGVGKEMDKNIQETEKLLEDKWEHLGYMERRPEHRPKGKEPGEHQPPAAKLAEYLATERRRVFGGRPMRGSHPPIRRAASTTTAATVAAIVTKQQTADAYDGDGMIIFSGIQPTGVPHLGNYLGAMREWKRLQDTAQPSTKLFFCIVDLHAMTVPRAREELYENRIQMLAALLAMGLDPKRCTIFFQSAVSGHAELQWILSCTASTGYLSRMTQWKSKMQLGEDASLNSAKARRHLKHGLFSYPILQAADVLLYRATHVPVGEDQRQHLEFARECVTNFNHAYQTDCLVSPMTLISPAKRVMSLTNPLQKMSKSDPSPKSRIHISDSPETINARIKGALTDSVSDTVTYDREKRPGVANLIEIFASFDPQGRTPAELGEEMRGVRIVELKEMVADVICHELAQVRQDYLFYTSSEKRTRLHDLANYGNKRAAAAAAETMALVREAVGLNPI
ncbi:hypothetical protein C8A03DRAFT_43706 [Achaetomium macrosporum]|uniref:Small ribosomal subunit protein uS10m n=1 Tax=Achaetomium macrosporum TaxID=79813 RepID=A0AAN7CAS4_9PEZI|nr:hypothetical protein C8A03DRAFT_43706 [Achaetomium macrosporum]